MKRLWVFVGIVVLMWSSAECKKYTVNLGVVSGRYRFDLFNPVIFFGLNDTMPISTEMLDTLAVRLMRNPDCNLKLRGYISPQESKGNLRMDEDFARKRAGYVSAWLMKNYAQLQGRVFVDAGLYDFKYAPFEPESLNARVEVSIEVPAVRPRIVYTTEKKKRWAYYLDAVVSDFGIRARDILMRNPDIFITVQIVGVDDKVESYPLVRQLEQRLSRALGDNLSARILINFLSSADPLDEAKAEISLSGFYLLWAPVYPFDVSDSIFITGDKAFQGVSAESVGELGCVFQTKDGLAFGYGTTKDLNVYRLFSPVFDIFSSIRLCCGNVVDDYRFKFDEINLLLGIPIGFFYARSESLIYPDIGLVISLLARQVEKYIGKLDSLGLVVEVSAPSSYGAKLAQMRLAYILQNLRDAIAYRMDVPLGKMDDWLMKNRVSVAGKYELVGGRALSDNVVYLWLGFWKVKR